MFDEMFNCQHCEFTTLYSGSLKSNSRKHSVKVLEPHTPTYSAWISITPFIIYEPRTTT